MPLRKHVDVGWRPNLDVAELLTALREEFGDRYEVYEPGRFQVPDVMVKRSDSDGAAVQLLQGRLRKRTRIRIYPLAPSIAQREWKPVGMARQRGELMPLVDEVVAFVERNYATG